MHQPVLLIIVIQKNDKDRLNSEIGNVYIFWGDIRDIAEYVEGEQVFSRLVKKVTISKKLHFLFKPNES